MPKHKRQAKKNYLIIFFKKKKRSCYILLLCKNTSAAEDSVKVKTYSFWPLECQSALQEHVIGPRALRVWDEVT